MKMQQAMTANEISEAAFEHYLSQERQARRFLVQHRIHQTKDEIALCRLTR